MAAYAARAGLECYVFVPEDTEEGKLIAFSEAEAVADAIQQRALLLKRLSA